MDKLTATDGRPRTDFIDRLRVVLTAMVIVHHAAITYGGSGGWFYREVTDSGLPSSMGLTLLTAVNQAFFMGMFFLIAGYFTPASLAKKGAARFLGDRLVRLGVPLLVFGFVLGPLTVALAGAPSGQPVVGRWVELMANGVFIIGPLWFALALLIFALGWVVWATVRNTQAEADLKPGPSVPAWPSWLMAAVGVGAAALLLRQWMPVGQSLFGLQLGYFASYAFLFALGCHAASGRWLERVGAAQAKGWAIVSVLALPVVFIAAALSASPDGTAANVNGGLGLAAVVYAFWEPFVAWGIITSLLYVFRTRFNRASAQWSRWSNQAYGAFIVHAPVLVGISALASGWKGPVLLKFVVVTVLATVLSFGIAGWLRRLPGATRIL
jgi:peptidoglycan/LPS O-acetylase OafA/YrhL